MLERIVFKDGKEIKIEDVNQLTKDQILKIQDKAKTMTMANWRSSENTDKVLIKLTDEQKQHFIDTKNYIVKGKTAHELLELNYIYITPHLERRGSWRIENRDPDLPMRVKTKIAISQLFMDAREQDLLPNAHWKGYPTLSYNIKGTINGKKVTVSFSLSNKIIWVTIFENETSKRDYGNSISSLLNQDLIQALKEIGE